MELNDSYKTIAIATNEILFKEKNSKFYGYAFPITSEAEIKNHLDLLKKKHFNAVHFCYAYQIGINPAYHRVNDDGEPNNTAGIPIYGQIQSFELTNLIVIIVRYFGGTKLGVGGLISAYKTAAQLTLASSSIIEKTIDVHYIISFDYKNINKVMRIIKEKKLQIVSQKMEFDCKIEIATRKKNATMVLENFENLHEVEIKLKD